MNLQEFGKMILFYISSAKLQLRNMNNILNNFRVTYFDNGYYSNKIQIFIYIYYIANIEHKYNK